MAQGPISNGRELPSDPAQFWSGGALPAEIPATAGSALEKLGPSPFPRAGFPLLGFLATVYDHISEQALNASKPQAQ